MTSGSAEPAGGSIRLLSVSRITMVTVDATEPRLLADFWAAALGARVEHDWGEYAVVDSAPRMAFQRVADPTPGKNRVHVDLETDDLATEVARLVGLGAIEIASVEMRGASWVVLADPEDNQFCVIARLDLDSLGAAEPEIPDLQPTE